MQQNIISIWVIKKADSVSHYEEKWKVTMARAIIAVALFSQILVYAGYNLG